MKALGIFRGFPGLGRVVAGVSLLERLRNQYGVDIGMVSYLQGKTYLDSKGYLQSDEVSASDYCAIGLLPTGKFGATIHRHIKSFAPDIILIDGEPLMLHSIRVSYPNSKIIALLNPADVDNPSNDKEAMDFFTSLYSEADLCIVHGLRKVSGMGNMRKALSISTVLRQEILSIKRRPEKNVFCLLGGGTVNVGSQFVQDTLEIAKWVNEMAKKLPDRNFIIVGASSNICRLLKNIDFCNNIVIQKDILSPVDYYTSTSLIITRSGRNSLSEVAYLGIPTITFITGDNYRREEQRQNIMSLSAQNILAVDFETSVDWAIKQLASLEGNANIGSQFKEGSDDAIKAILRIINL